MDKHILPNRPPTALGETFDEATGLRLAPPGLLQVARWKHLTEDPALVKAEADQPRIPAGR